MKFVSPLQKKCVDTLRHTMLSMFSGISGCSEAHSWTLDEDNCLGLCRLGGSHCRCGKLNISCRPETIMMAEAPLGWGDLKQKRGALMFALEDSR